MEQKWGMGNKDFVVFELNCSFRIMLSLSVLSPLEQEQYGCIVVLLLSFKKISSRFFNSFFRLSSSGTILTLI